MASNLLRVGVIGVGLQGETLVGCFQSLPNATVAAVADLNEERARTVAERHGVPRWFADSARMLDEIELDAVALVLPDHLHRDAALAVIESGRHLLIEKPLATTVADGEAIVEAAKRRGVHVMVNFSNRFQFALEQVRAAYLDGKLGKALYCYQRLSNTITVPTKMLSWAGHTRLPFWLMSHSIDRVRWTWNSDPTRVYAIQRSVVLKERGIDTPDLYVATVDFANGAAAVFESCWVLPETSPSVVDSQMQFIFTGGSVSIDACKTMVEQATAAGFTYPRTLGGKVRGQPVGMVVEGLRHFVNAILMGKAPEASGEDGLMVLKTSAAIVESAETGRPIEL